MTNNLHYVMFCFVLLSFYERMYQFNAKHTMNTVFTRVSTRGAHLIFGFQRGALIRGRHSFEGGTLLREALI